LCALRAHSYWNPLQLNWGVMPHPRHVIKSLIALTFLVPLCAQAQEARIGWLADAVLGVGPRTQQAGSVWFRPESTPYGRLSIALRTRVRDRFAALMILDRAGALMLPAYGDRCLIAPDRSGCAQNFRWPAVNSAGAGLRSRVGGAASLELAGGVGLTREPSRFVRGDVEWLLAPHLALVVGAEHRVARQADGTHLWWRPMFGGIRLR
jgi:hypothetical protein